MKRLFLLFFLSLSILGVSWTIAQENEILAKYQKYAEVPRELAYVHLNKTTYIKGETLGFTAYLLDKENKQFSTETTNLYCTLSDEKEQLVKQKLLPVVNGVAVGNFAIDSLFSAGKYTFKAYTNWMRNFNESNHFAQSIQILDPEHSTTTQAETVATKMDAQFLPEGGHLISDIETIVGVVIKDHQGFGIPGLEGSIRNGNGKTITQFKVNALGIGKFPLIPKTGMQYKASISYNGKTFSFTLPAVETSGIGIKIQPLGTTKVGVSLRTNAITQKRMASENFTLLIHNGKETKALDINFDDTPTVVKVIPNTDLFAGINIFTLFNAKNLPVLERLYFNYDPLSFMVPEVLPSIKENDSISFRIALGALDNASLHQLSVSVLPTDTQSYNFHHNLSSAAFLRPYVKGPIEKAYYYFTEITPKKKYELDMLLLTQGWSSYSWNSIFNNPPDYKFNFEKGISLTGTQNGNGIKQFFLYPLVNNSSSFLALTPGKNTFTQKQLFPLEGEEVRIGGISAKGEMKKPALYAQFSPSTIPKFTGAKLAMLPLKKPFNLKPTEMALMRFDGIQNLDEVVLTKKRSAERIEKIKNRTLGNVEIFGERERLQYQYLSNYLSQRGFAVDESPNGEVRIFTRNPLSPNNAVPIVYLDGILLSDFDLLYRFRLDVVDYIEVNRSGVGGGIRGGAGIIKIVTDPQKRFEFEKKDVYTAYKPPLSFSVAKEYYTPNYGSYTSSFFTSYGTLGWFPKLIPNEKGVVTMRMEDNKVSEITLFIEGIVNGTTFISAAKQIPSN